MSPGTARALAAGLALLLARQGWAGEAAPLQTVQTVQVAGRYDNAVGGSDAASQGSVGAERLRSRAAASGGELLEFVPGMVVTQHSGEGKANQYFLRGYNLDHGTDFATFVDGMPVNMRSHAHGQGYTDLNFLLPELVRRIDYRKGPYFAGDGDFASAGAAHIRLADSLPAGVASLSLGEYGHRRLVLADSFAAGPGTLLYGIEGVANDGPWLTPERMRKRGATLCYSQGGARQDFSVTAMAYSNRWNASDQIPLGALRAGQVERYGTLDPSDGGATARYSLSSALRRRGDGGAFELDLYLVQSRLDLFSNFTYFLADPLRGDQFMQSERRRVAGLNLGQSWSGEVAGFAVHNRVGLQARQDWLAPVGLYAAAARRRGDTVREDRVRQGSAGLYAESAVQWLPALRTIAGARVEAARFDVASSLAGGGGKVGAHIASPKLTMVLGPWARTEYFLHYGTGFHSNDARGVTGRRAAANGAAATPLVATRGGELGVRSELLPGLQSSLALWSLAVDSELLFVGDAGATAPSRASRRRGIEWSNHYRVARWLRLDLELAASRARFSGAGPDGDFVPGALDRAAAFGLAVSAPGRWEGSVELRYIGPRPLLADNSVRSAATVLGSARLLRQIDAATSVALDVANLFDRRASDIEYYYASRVAGGPAGGTDDIHFHPVAPRSFKLTLSRRF